MLTQSRSINEWANFLMWAHTEPDVLCMRRCPIPMGFGETVCQQVYDHPYKANNHDDMEGRSNTQVPFLRGSPHVLQNIPRISGNSDLGKGVEIHQPASNLPCAIRKRRLLFGSAPLKGQRCTAWALRAHLLLEPLLYTNKSHDLLRGKQCTTTQFIVVIVLQRYPHQPMSYGTD